MQRRKSIQVDCGGVKIGGDAPISVQSMLNIPPHRVEENIAAAKKLKAAGCEILRIAVPNEDGVKLISALKNSVDIPIVADIHFDYRLALASVDAGVDKVRINPGNIGDDDNVRRVAQACKSRNIPIRIGVNSGSVSKQILQKYGSPTPEALVESALYHASLLTKWDFNDIVLSLKSSNVVYAIEAYTLAAQQCDYPLHVGITETGTRNQGTIKSAVGIGAILSKGIGDTIRVSLTDDPVYEVETAIGILKALGLRRGGINIISCPTCGRTKSDLIGTVHKVEAAIKEQGLDNKPLTVAIMGCEVNGPGEAREADIGLACGEKNAIIFKHGEKVRSIPIEDCIDEMIKEIKEYR